MRLVNYIVDKLPYDFKKSLSGFVGGIEVFNRPGFFLLPGSNNKYQIKGEHQELVLDLIRPGDVLLRKYDHYLSGYTIPGYWDHAALCVGSQSDIKYKYSVIHMVADGIMKEPILKFLRCDDIAILRCNDEELNRNAVDNAYNDLENKIQYDYSTDFMKDRKYMVCTEGVWYWFGEPKFLDTMIKDVIMPDDMYNSIWEVVWGGLREGDISYYPG